MNKILDKVVIVAALTFVFMACGVVDVSALLMPPSSERELGEEFDTNLRDSIGHQFLKETDSFHVYVNGLKDSLVSTIPEETWDDILPEGVSQKDFFTVSVIDTNIPNAFAVPGGFFYIYTGILPTMDNEAELVAVMGHEIGHVLGHHSRDRMLDNAAFSAAIELLIGGEGAGALLAQVGASYFLMENGRDDELEADEFGVHFAKDIQVKPTGIQSYFGKGIVDAEGNCEDSSGFLDGIGEVFSTHPPHCDRVKQSQGIIANFDSAVLEYPDNEAVFLSKTSKYQK